MAIKKKIEFTCAACNSNFAQRKDTQKISFKKFGLCLCQKCARKEGVNKRIAQKRTLSDAHKKKMFDARKAKYKTLTIDCQCCGKSFLVPYGQRDRMYCGRSCQSKSIKKQKLLLKTSICLECGDEFDHYSERKYCSIDCSSCASSRLRLGENNPAFLKDEEKESGECPRCKKVFFYTRMNLHKGQKRIYCSLACSRSGSNKNNTIKSNGPIYPREFRKIKPIIKNRDAHKCIMCDSAENLEVHHINYNKQDCSDSNLITLCKRCHTLTHHERSFWEQVFTGLNSGCKIVKKGWGLEIHYCNNNKYCLKHLVFFKDRKFSLHSHDIKSELWLVSWGEFECFIQKNGISDYFLLKQGETILLNQKVEHQIQAIKNSIITEVSTTDYPEDSYRIEKGD
jgi:mannose-6-phosphate isomerase-like protein (cupin superfamily)